jgi:NADPH-dependent ferric siderophore reductase
MEQIEKRVRLLKVMFSIVFAILKRRQNISAKMTRLTFAQSVLLQTTKATELATSLRTEV